MQVCKTTQLYFLFNADSNFIILHSALFFDNLPHYETFWSFKSSTCSIVSDKKNSWIKELFCHPSRIEQERICFRKVRIKTKSSTTFINQSKLGSLMSPVGSKIHLNDLIIVYGVLHRYTNARPGSKPFIIHLSIKKTLMESCHFL